MRSYRYLFGPVPSRRLGRSLGVDLVPLKTCSANCVFCQLGRTPQTTLERRDYVPIAAVLAELNDWRQRGEEADFVKLAGSGEPTLHLHFGQVLDFVRSAGRFRSALLTNGTLFHLPEVRQAACQADLVKLPLSAWDQASFERVNRPHPSLQFEQIVEGYRSFRRAFRGEIWMEVFLVGGLNAEAEDVAKIARLAATIAPDRIHLNTAVRPPAEALALAVPEPRLRELAAGFQPPAEIIAEFSTRCATRRPADAGAWLALLRRHPATAGQMAQAFGVAEAEALRLLGEWVQAGRLQTERRGAQTYFVPLAPPEGTGS